MFTHQFFDLLLNLDDNWQVYDVDANCENDEVQISIQYIGKQINCLETLKSYPIYDHVKVRKWRHLDTMQYKTHISCRLPRYKRNDGKILTLIPPWASKHERHTYLFEHAVIDLLKATKNQSKTAEIMRCSFDVVNRIIHLSTTRGLARRNISDLKFEHLSIDEKSFKKGHKYVSILSHPRSGCVLDIEDGRNKESVRLLIDKYLTQKQQRDIQTISMDMWKAYLTVTQEKLPNAEVVHDRFHLVKYLNDAIDKVRKREVKTNEELRNTRYVFLKNPENLTEKQRVKFESISNTNYQVSKAWRIKENFRELFNKESVKLNGFILLTEWMEVSAKECIKEVTKVVNTFLDHLPGVIISFF